MPDDKRENPRKELVGIVLSDKMQKTIVVQTRRKTRHPVYGKVIEKANKFKVHDEKNEAKIGDEVRIAETRPLSKDKRWRLVEILSHGHGVKVRSEEAAESAPKASE
jgi:small subunit ribosomal protein S17